jgi:hypothetical protein
MNIATATTSPSASPLPADPARAGWQRSIGFLNEIQRAVTTIDGSIGGDPLAAMVARVHAIRGVELLRPMLAYPQNPGFATLSRAVALSDAAIARLDLVQHGRASSSEMQQARRELADSANTLFGRTVLPAQ